LNSIKALFFDVGATLLTPAEDEGVTFTLLADGLGIALDPAEVVEKVPLMYGLYEQLYEQDSSFWGDNVRARAIWIEMYEYMASLLNVPQTLQRELAETVYRYYFAPGAWKAYDDVLPTLDMLANRGYRMGLISNWDSSLSSVIEGLNMAHYFEIIISSAEVSLHKPMPEIFELALERLGVGAHEALHVGDHVYADAKGAANVGITPILLDRKNRHAHFEGHRVASLLEIPSLL
jgi:putative hydrolase of the HAD superfamily